MDLTKSLEELAPRCAADDSAFAEALPREGTDAMPTGDVETGKAIPRDCTKATVGFEKLGEAMDTPAKSLILAFSPRDNPQTRNLLGVIGCPQKHAGIELPVMLRAP